MHMLRRGCGLLGCWAPRAIEAGGAGAALLRPCRMCACLPSERHFGRENSAPPPSPAASSEKPPCMLRGRVLPGCGRVALRGAMPPPTPGPSFLTPYLSTPLAPAAREFSKSTSTSLRQRHAWCGAVRCVRTFAEGGSVCEPGPACSRTLRGRWKIVWAACGDAGGRPERMASPDDSGAVQRSRSLMNNRFVCEHRARCVSV